MIPFFIYYSMFGFQRVGDLIWAFADSRGKGFLMGGTAGRTTLSGEGLQHQDGHSLVLASTVPTCAAYDPAYAYEIAVIVQDGIRRMYRSGGPLLLPDRLQRKLRACRRCRRAQGGNPQGDLQIQVGGWAGKAALQLFGSGPILNEAVRRAADSGGAVRRGDGCVERDQLQRTAARGTAQWSAGTGCIPPSRARAVHRSRRWRGRDRLSRRPIT